MSEKQAKIRRRKISSVIMEHGEEVAAQLYGKRPVARVFTIDNRRYESYQAGRENNV